MIEGLLALSTTRGRYAIGDCNGFDLNAGKLVEIEIGGRWMPGVIRRAPGLAYVTPGLQTLEEAWGNEEKPRAIGGYYVEIDGGGICGLCVGMRVRIP